MHDELTPSSTTRKTPLVRLVRPRPELLALYATLAAAAVTRLSWLDLMEFKGDEANATRLALHVLGYSEPGVGRFFPTAGLVSSVGIPNPPFFVYLVAVPMAVVRSPIAAAVAIAAANVGAIWLAYLAGTRCFGRLVGLTAAMLLALSPWGIVFSRKIWAQDLLPIWTTLFVICLYALVVEGRRRAPFWLIVIAGTAVGLHFSACVLVIVLVVALVWQRRDLDLRSVAAGVLVVAALYAPYAIYHVGSILHTARHHSAYTGPGFLHRLETNVRYTGGIVGGGNMTYLIGTGSALATTTSIVLGLLGPAGLALAVWRESASRRRLATLLLVWYALPLTIITLLEIRPYMHYFIILLPLPYFGIAYLAQILFAARRSFAVVAVVAVSVGLASFLLLDLRFFRTILRDGGAPGDYGTAYRYKVDAASHALERAAGRPYLLGLGASFTATKRLLPYRFLIWNMRPDPNSPPGRPLRGFLIVDRFAAGAKADAAAPHGTSLMRATFGPLALYEVRVGPRSAR